MLIVGELLSMQSIEGEGEGGREVGKVLDWEVEMGKGGDGHVYYGWRFNGIS